jgi:uncharacterized protein (TIGR03437 family)
VVTQVKTASGLPQVAFNTWVEIHGTNLVPPDTPATGVDWSKAADFANGQMPTQLGPISVTIANLPAYVYWYCSAATNPNCATDQINVLAPLLPTAWEGLAAVVVTSNGVSSAPLIALRPARSPAFLAMDAMGHITAQHGDYSLLGPASLYPGVSTPAKPGETVILYGVGFGLSGTPPVAGSSSQSGLVTPLPTCWISGAQATVQGAALISPGLYQVNLTIPRGTPSGDNPLACQILGVLTAPGALIAVQQ